MKTTKNILYLLQISGSNAIQELMLPFRMKFRVQWVLKYSTFGSGQRLTQTTNTNISQLWLNIYIYIFYWNHLFCTFFSSTLYGTFICTFMLLGKSVMNTKLSLELIIYQKCIISWISISPDRSTTHTVYFLIWLLYERN